MENKHGGKREGAGRKTDSATLHAQEFRRQLAEMIMKEAEEWKIAIADSAKGHYVMQKTASGEVRVYKKSPDAHAWEKAMDRAFGKPEQPVDMKSDGEKIGTVIIDPKTMELLSEFEKRLKESIIKK